MRSSAAAAAMVLLALSQAFSAPAQEQPDTVIRSDVREVVLDVIVRNKSLGLAKKLKATDFSVTEDGVPQTIKGFRFVSGREASLLPGSAAPSGSPTSAPATAGTLREPNFVSIVFGDMSADSRHNALEAATNFIDQEFQNETYASIFRLNLRLNAVQPFTRRHDLLRRAVAVAVNGSSLELAHANAGVINETTYGLASGPGGVSLRAGTDITQAPDMATTGADGGPLSTAQQAIAGIIGAQREMVSYVTGMRQMQALLQLAEFEAKIPGRKTVIYLAEGLIKPPGFPEMMRQVIAAANRANVSFYCIDVRGLQLATSNGITSGLVANAAALSASQRTTPALASEAAKQMKQDDLVLEALSSHTQLNMAELAEGTGGFAVFSTNDFRKNMARVMEDVRTHYEISYVPVSALYDGHFREVQVHLRDPRLTVQSRRGYFAVPEMNGVPLAPYEMDALRTLQSGPHGDFPFAATALRFQPLGGGFRYEMTFELETSQLESSEDPETHKARLHAVFLALVKDTAGQVAARVSQEVDREVPAGRLEEFRRGRIVLTLPFELKTGRYTIDAATLDAHGSRSSTKRLSLVVPKPGEPALSSIAVVHSLAPLEAPPDPGNPLEFDGGRVLPSVREELPSSERATVYFAVYANPGAGKPRVTVEFVKDGQIVARQEPDAGASAAEGRVPFLAAATLPSGDYLARVTLEQAGRISRETTPLSVR